LVEIVDVTARLLEVAETLLGKVPVAGGINIATPLP
jgi:hypothetical protein